jgi:hypothetical protein
LCIGSQRCEIARQKNPVEAGVFSILPFGSFRATTPHRGEPEQGEQTTHADHGDRAE